MVEHVLKVAAKRPALSCVRLHVQISNEEAIAFYKKHGFEVKETKENYYQKIEPADAYVLVRDLKKAADGAEEAATAASSTE